MFNPLAYANAAPAGVAVLETVADDSIVARMPFVPLRRTTVNGRWEGPLAEITITHTYVYTRAQCSLVLEAIYRFPLPGDAAVRRVVVTFGDVEIVAELKERRAAEQAYEEAKRQGQQAALTTRESPDVFTLRVAGLQPDQEVVVETTCVLLSRPESGHWTLHIPLTTAPRYMRHDEVGRRSANAQPLAVFRDPGHRFALDLITATGQISSATHALRASDEDGHRRIQLAEDEQLPDRDCVLTWSPARAEQAAPSAALLQVLTGEQPDYTYFVALVSPPEVAGERQGPAREAIVLVDHSGSMSGNKWQAADHAALEFLRALTPRDSLNLGVFHSSTRWLSVSPVPAGPETLAQAERFLSAQRDGGGTELGVALEQALMQRLSPDALSRQIVIITDAQVTDDARILNMIEERAQEPNRRRVSVLCIDAAPNAHLTQELAALGGGIARFLTSAPGEGDMAAALSDILAGWSQPVAAGLTLEVSWPGLEVSDARPVTVSDGTSVVDLGDLTMGRPLWVVGRLPSGGDGELIFRLAGAGLEPLEAHVAPGAGATAAKGVALAGALKAVYGAYRVQGLERLAEAGGRGQDLDKELRRLGYDQGHLLAAEAPAVPTAPVYPENAECEWEGRIEALLLREALDYGLLCSVTGFVAVRKERGVPVEYSTLIGNALPEGWDGDQFLSAASPSAASPALAGLMGSAMLRSGNAAQVRSMRMSARGPEMARSDVLRETGGERALYRRHRPTQPLTVGYAGRPVTGVAGAAVLFDTSRAEDARRLTRPAGFTWLEVRYPGGEPDARGLSPRLAIVIEVDGGAVAEVRLLDILRRGGKARIHVLTGLGAQLRLVLQDPDRAWESVAPEIEVELT